MIETEALGHLGAFPRANDKMMSDTRLHKSTGEDSPISGTLGLSKWIVLNRSGIDTLFGPESRSRSLQTSVPANWLQRFDVS